MFGKERNTQPSVLPFLNASRVIILVPVFLSENPWKVNASLHCDLGVVFGSCRCSKVSGGVCLALNFPCSFEMDLFKNSAFMSLQKIVLDNTLWQKFQNEVFKDIHNLK